MRISLIDYGTFCDFKITYSIAKRLLIQGHTVVYITSVSNKLSSPDFNAAIKSGKLVVHQYDITQYIDISNSEELNKGVTIYKYLDPKSYRLAFYIHNTLKPVLKKVLIGVDYTLMHFPSLLFASAIPEGIPTGVFFVAPGYPNTSLPWVLSNEIQEKDFLKVNKKYTSTETIYNTMSLLALSPTFYREFFSKSDLFAMWEKMILPLPDSIFKVKQIGSICDTLVEKFPPTPEVVKRFLDSKKLDLKLVYFSTGSFKIGEKIIFIIEVMLKKGFSILLHGSVSDTVEKALINKNFENLFLFNSFVSHEFLIPKVDLVVTSGSLCMTAIANKAGKPLFYIPILNEQYLWAKLYLKNTGQKYIDKFCSGPVIRKTVNVMIKGLYTNKKLELFTKKLQKTTKTKDPIISLVGFVLASAAKNTQV